MSEPPEGGSPEQPDAGGPAASEGGAPDVSSPDYSSPDYNGAPDGAGDDGPRRTGAHRASGRPTPPPPPPAGAPLWPQPDYQPDEPLKRPLIDTLPLRLLQIGGAIVLVIVLIVVFVEFFGHNSTDNGTVGAGLHKTTVGATKTGAPATGVTKTGTTTTSGTAAATVAPTPTAKPTGKPTGKPTTPATTKPATTKPPTTKPPTSKPATSKPPTSKPTPTAKPTTAAPPPVDVKAPLLVLNNSRIHGLAVTGSNTFTKGGWTVTGTGNFSGRLPQTTVFYSPGFQAAAETLARQFPTVTAVEARIPGLPGNAPLTVVLTRYFKP